MELALSFDLLQGTAAVLGMAGRGSGTRAAGLWGMCCGSYSGWPKTTRILHQCSAFIYSRPLWDI